MADIDTTVNIHQYVEMNYQLGHVNPKPFVPTVYTVKLDTLYDTSQYMLIHGTPADSVHWRVGSESRWRKGDSTVIRFERLLVGQPLLIRKRVWGQRSGSCPTVLRPYYETTRLYPTAHRLTFWQRFDGKWEGKSTVHPEGHWIRLGTFPERPGAKVWMLNLRVGYPIYDPDDPYWAQRGGGFPEHFLNSNIVGFSHQPYLAGWSDMSGYMGIIRYITRDSLTIEYVRGNIDAPGNHQFFWGKRVR